MRIKALVYYIVFSSNTAAKPVHGLGHGPLIFTTSMRRAADCQNKHQLKFMTSSSFLTQSIISVRDLCIRERGGGRVRGSCVTPSKNYHPLGVGRAYEKACNIYSKQCMIYFCTQQGLVLGCLVAGDAIFRQSLMCLIA